MTWASERGTAKFGSIAFPWVKMDIRGGVRFVHHKAPHIDGSITELLGRETYEFKFAIPADNNLIQFPGFYDNQWPKLRGFFELSTQDTLEIPGIGAIEAWASSWSESADARKSSGIAAEVSFFEDTNNLFLDAEAVGREAGSLPSVVSNFQIERANYEAAPQSPSMSTPRWTRVKANMQSLESAALSLVAYRDKYELYVSSQITQVNRVLDLATAVTEDLHHEIYTHQSLRNAVSSLWATTRRFKNTVVVKDPIVYESPIDGTISQIALRIYGMHKHVVDIMHLNVIPQPLNIPVGTRLLVPRPDNGRLGRSTLGASI
jgi:prophage DNA circulation protein